MWASVVMVLWGLFLLVGMGACGVRERTGVPAELADKAVIAGMTEVRAWGGEITPAFKQSLVDSVVQARKINPQGVRDEEGYVNLLAISGGGSDGAYGVGLLCGWSDHPTSKRPVFKVVTGVSTGALMAPFIFAGPEWNGVIAHFYTSVEAKDIYRERKFGDILGNPEAITSTEPLMKQLRLCVTPEFLKAVAKAHGEGRRLYIGTTNLDALRLVVWDMGKIASYGTAESAELFRRVMLASASIPVAFPPVEMPVVAEGKKYTEIHVDGGVLAEVFLLGFTVNLADVLEGAGVANHDRRLRVYVLRNAQLQAQYQIVELRILKLASRAVSGLIASQGIGDLYRIYAVAKEHGLGFKLACIPDDFPRTAQGPFDKGEMNRLYNLGYRQARAGYPWMTQPPQVEGIRIQSSTIPAPVTR